MKIKRNCIYPDNNICPWCLGDVYETGKTPALDKGTYHYTTKEKNLKCGECGASWSVMYSGNKKHGKNF